MAGVVPGIAIAGGAALLAVVRVRLIRVMAVALLAGLVAGSAADARIAAVHAAGVPQGRVEMTAVAVRDPHRLGSDLVVAVRPTSLRTAAGWTGWDGPPLLVEGPPGSLAAGEPIAVVGAIDDRVRWFRGQPVAGIVRARRVTALGRAPNPVLALGNSLRRHVLGSLDEAAASPPGALLAGFLIGDVSRLPDDDREALRSAGLSHFVAVSGSNVALFLAAWWLAGGPLGMGPRRRAAYGMVGLVVFAVVTRWEPSVVRASVMAGLVLAGRWSGRPITPWTALGGAVALSLVVAPELAGNAGFGLSVAATAGIIAGAPLWTDRQPRAVWAVLGATISAQVAVAPLLLLWFGSVPLVAPLSNLIAAPVVSAATAVGGIGAVTRIEPLVDAGAWLAGIVLGVARASAGLPQLGTGAVGVAAIVGLASTRAGWLRPALPIAAVALVVTGIAPARAPQQASVTFLDVGQGDATVFRGPQGGVILVDGGPDRAVLEAHLERLGIDRIDLLVITHRHADHSTGLLGLPGRIPIGLVWHAPQEGEGGSFDAVLAATRSAGSVVEVPAPGDVVSIGSFVVEVVGPKRRYAAPNDGSVVLLVHAAGRTVVMSGDAEVAAQADLGPLPGDILKVPHQGAATSDPEWLAASAPAVAIISVGPNDFGHPSPEVVGGLEEAGAIVLRTDLHGSIELPLDRFADAARALASSS